MQRFSKFFALLFAAMLVFGLLGCPQTTPEPAEPQEPVGVRGNPAPTYTVTYVDGVDGAEIAVPSDTTAYHAGDTVTVKFEGIGTRDGYTFAGWSNGTTTYATGGTTTFTMGSANVTLTAQWQVYIPTYTVTYLDGVDSAEIAVPSDTATYHTGDTVTVSFGGIGTRSGYFFAGWSDGTTTYATGGTTTFSMGSANVTLTAQWLAYIGTKGPNEAKSVGDIVFKDGTATPYSENLTLTNAQKAAAVAIIFYVGTGNATVGSNENILGQKNLGIALNDSSTEQTEQFTWGLGDFCSEEFRAYQVSEYYNTDGTLNSDYSPVNLSVPYYKFDGSTQMDGHFRWYFYGSMDGSANTSIVRDSYSTNGSSYNDAFGWVLNYGQNHGITGTYASGWYLPTITELRILYDKKEIIKNAFTKTGKTDPFGDNENASKEYWSSNQYTPINEWGQDQSNCAFCYDIGYGHVIGSATKASKGDEKYVLCIRQF